MVGWRPEVEESVSFMNQSCAERLPSLLGSFLQSVPKAITSCFLMLLFCLLGVNSLKSQMCIFLDISEGLKHSICISVQKSEGTNE